MIPSSEKPLAHSSFAIWSAMTSVYIIWGSTYLAIRFAIETIPPLLKKRSSPLPQLEKQKGNELCFTHQGSNRRNNR